MKRYIKEFYTKIPTIILIALFIFTYRYIHQNNDALNTATTVDISYVQKIFPEATSVTQKPIHKDIYDVFRNGTHIGKILINHSDSVIGYAGTVPIIIGANKKNIITGIAFLPNNETPSFIKRIESKNFMNSWNGILITDITSSDVDVITGATMTTKAVIKNVLSSTSGVKAIAGSGGDSQIKRTVMLSLVLILSLLLYSSVKFKHHKIYVFKKFRAHIQILEILFFGFLTGTMLSMYLFESWIINGIDFFNSPIIVIIAALAILIPLFTHKQYYCIYVCPFGAIQELTNKVAIKFKIPQKRLPTFIKHIRNAFLIIVLAIILFAKKIDISEFEPFPAFLFKSASTITLSVAVTFIILSLFYKNPWCRIFCPTGNFLDLLKKKWFKK